MSEELAPKAQLEAPEVLPSFKDEEYLLHLEAATTEGEAPCR